MEKQHLLKEMNLLSWENRGNKMYESMSTYYCIYEHFWENSNRCFFMFKYKLFSVSFSIAMAPVSC